MKDQKLIFIMLLSAFFAFCAKAEDPLVYEDFESYVVGMEGTNDDGNIEINWWHFPPDTCYLKAYADNVYKNSGSMSMRLDSPLQNGGADWLTEDWGVNFRDDYTNTNVNPYNVVTAMIRIGAESSITTCSLVARDVFGNNISTQKEFSVPHDGNWHKISERLDNTGNKYYMRCLLLYFGIPEGVSETASQFWIDDIKFERAPEVNDFLQIDVNGPSARKGSIVKYSFVMTQQPTANVTFTIDPNSKLNFGNGYGIDRTLEFTTANWNVKQEIAVEVNSTGYDYKVPSAIVSFTVSVVSEDWNINDALSLTYPVKLYGKYSAPYVISTDTPTLDWNNGKDNFGFDLANGYFQGTFYVDSTGGFGEDWVAWWPVRISAPAYADITFDLESVKDINTIDILHAGLQSDVYPGMFNVSYSTDNVTFTADANNYEAYLGSGLIATSHLEVNAKSARYVKLRVHCRDNEPNKGFYLSEVEFNKPVDDRTFPRYTYDAATKPLGSTNKDAYQTCLMNGVMNTSSDWVYFVNASNQAYASGILYVDYGKVREFSSISLNYFYYTYVPSSPVQKVKLSFSNDGVTYGTPIEVTGWSSTSSSTGKTDAWTFAAQTGQYVKVEIVGNGTKKLMIGEIILGNRKQMTYEYDASTPVWGGTGTQGDIAWGTMAPLRFGDLANAHIPLVANAYSDSDWVEWAPAENNPDTPPYGIITFNLRETQPKLIKNVAVTYGLYPHKEDINNGIEAPNDVQVAFSTDGVNFSGYQTLVGEISHYLSNDSNNTNYVWTPILSVPTPTNANYVRVKINSYKHLPQWWLYIAEIKFNVFAGDVNDDGKVDFKDVKMMSDQWLQLKTTTTTPSADIAGNDDIVNFEDFAELAMQWMY
jgi:hypothetical protein